MQWTGDNTASISEWFGSHNVVREDEVLILRGATDVQLNQWIVLSPSNRLHICKPGLFEEVHELALANTYPDDDLHNLSAHAEAARSASNYWKKMAQMLAKQVGVELPKPPPGKYVG